MAGQHTESGGQRPERESYFWFLTSVGVALAFVGVVWTYGIIFPEAVGIPIGRNTDNSLDARGNVVGALFAGLAFVGVVAAIFLQWKELGYQREELRQTKLAMQASAQAQQRQTDELKEQTKELKQQVRLPEEDCQPSIKAHIIPRVSPRSCNRTPKSLLPLRILANWRV
jgi:hypothetical protein